MTTIQAPNPFQALADGGHPDHALTLALAFQHAHGGGGRDPMDQVWAIIRYARRVGHLPQGDYLMGCHFHAWVDCDSGEPFDFEALKEAAEEYQP
jgi:hypothetical protein